MTLVVRGTDHIPKVTGQTSHRTLPSALPGSPEVDTLRFTGSPGQVTYTSANLEEATRAASADHDRTMISERYQQSLKRYDDTVESLISNRPDQAASLRGDAKIAQQAMQKIYTNPEKVGKSEVDALIDKGNEHWSKVAGGSNDDVKKLRELNKDRFYRETDMHIHEQNEKVNVALQKIEAFHQLGMPPTLDARLEVATAKHQLATLQHMKSYQHYRDAELPLTGNDPHLRAADKEARSTIWGLWWGTAAQSLSAAEKVEKLASSRAAWGRVTDSPENIDHLMELWKNVFTYHTKQEIEALKIGIIHAEKRIDICSKAIE